MKSVLIAIVMLMTQACAQFETVDRSEVNRPSMSLNTGAYIQAPSPLTNLKSSNGQEVSSCTVCSH